VLAWQLTTSNPRARTPLCSRGIDRPSTRSRSDAADESADLSSCVDADRPVPCSGAACEPLRRRAVRAHG
jgi:hypothetical protein